jgi:probable blue pigment (indigoidine) exporter
LARRSPVPRDIAVACVAALGVAFVVIRPNAGIDPVGVLAALGANLSFATGVVLTKRFPPAPSRLAATAWQLLLGGAVLVPLMLLVEGTPPALSPRNVAGFAYLGLVGTALSFVLWFNGIRLLPPAAPPLLGLASPITGAALGWLLLGQDLSPMQLFGFVVTVGAIAYGALIARQHLPEVLGRPLVAERAVERGSSTSRERDEPVAALAAPALNRVHERTTDATSPRAFADEELLDPGDRTVGEEGGMVEHEHVAHDDVADLGDEQLAPVPSR